MSSSEIAISSTARLLLLSTSTIFGSGYFDYAEEQVREFLGQNKELLFIPYALSDIDSYADTVRARFARMGIRANSIHEAGDARTAVRQTGAMFIGGGNTFRLLKRLYDLELLAPIRARVKEGMLYLGASAGSNVAAPTIRTTNDMPIVEPPSFNALGLVRFQINPHYLDPEPGSTHMGETREERIVQFLEENSVPVLGLREGAMVRVENGLAELASSAGARLFRRGMEPVELAPGMLLNDLIRAADRPGRGI